MAHQHDIKRLSQFSTAEEYARSFISFLFQPIISTVTISLESDADATIMHFVIRLGSAGIEAVGLPIDG